MESLRRPSVLAAVAAALLTINLVVLVNDGDAPGLEIDGDGLAADGDAVGDDAAEDDPATSGVADDDTAADDGAGTDTSGAAADGESDAGADDAASGGGSGDEPTDDADGEDAGAEPSDGAVLGAPVAGTYTYASSGEWSMAKTNAETDQFQLPATATATVERDGDAWELRLDAGDRYADEFGFLLGADGGLDWIDWALERTAPNLGGQSRTTYACTGDSAHYRPDETGRSATHVCDSGAGVTSRGTIEHTGSEDVTLGDGSVVTADRLLYTYTLEGEGVSGGGQLDLWIDPSTGLRLREVRTISSTTVAGATTFEYREDVQFTLQSLDPS